VPKGMARLVLAHAEGQVAGTQVELIYNGAITCWYIGFDKELHAFYPNDALVWHSLSWGNAQGMRCYDFGGAGAPDKPYGPREFKAKFGGQLVNYGRATHVHRPLVLALSRVGYEWYRKRL
jgi:serine/alanine adding enzyme